MLHLNPALVQLQCAKSRRRHKRQSMTLSIIIPLLSFNSNSIIRLFNSFTNPAHQRHLAAEKANKQQVLLLAWQTKQTKLGRLSARMNADNHAPVDTRKPYRNNLWPSSGSSFPIKNLQREWVSLMGFIIFFFFSVFCFILLFLWGLGLPCVDKDNNKYVGK